MGFSGFINWIKAGWSGFKLIAEAIAGIAVVIGFVLLLDSQGVIQVPLLHRATVPDTISMQIANARALMEEAELTANIICQDPPDSEVSPGTVYKTDPRPDAKVDRWSAVAIYVKPPCT